MPLSTIDRGGRGGSMGAPIYQRSRTIHTPPQTPPYHGTLNGHGTMGPLGTMSTMPQHGHIISKNGTMEQKPLPGPPTLHAGVGYGNNGAAATMTLGRRGHYASLRAARTADTDLPLLGPNQGQYATLSKGCKTLESSDFY